MKTKIVAWYWTQPGGRTAYTPRHVRIWADMVRRHRPAGFEIAVVTDIRADYGDVEVIAPTNEFLDIVLPTWRYGRPQCLRRLSMFRRDAARLFGADRLICMDLDCIVAGPLQPLFEGDAEFRMFRGTANGRIYNGSMMMIVAGARPQVYERFTPAAAVKASRRFTGSDQAWISQCLGPGEATWGAEHGVQWWGDPRSVRSAADCRVMFFPGRAKPWNLVDCDDGFARKHYRAAPAGRRALVLGYAPTVWADLALHDLAGFEAVIASPEAARHWPGPVLAIAEDDDHAERLAVMHGLEPVWCGRTLQQEIADAAD